MSGIEELACHGSNTGTKSIESVSFLRYDNDLASREFVSGHASPARRMSRDPTHPT
jgi:hypothetical protein